MKKLFFAILTTAVSLAATNYTGAYVGKGTEPSARYPGGVPHTVTITLEQSGNSLTGTLQVDKGGIAKITSGTVSGNSISIVLGGNGFQATAQLTANGNQLTGTITGTTGAQMAVVVNLQ